MSFLYYIFSNKYYKNYINISNIFRYNYILIIWIYNTIFSKILIYILGIISFGEGNFPFEKYYNLKKKIIIIIIYFLISNILYF